MNTGGVTRVRAASAQLPAPSGHVDVRPTPPPTAELPPLPNTPSKARGPWAVDYARARHDARQAIDAIDWSKRDIVIWVPGTSNHTIHPAFQSAVRGAWAGASLIRLEYEASWRMRPSVATGIETLRLVLAAIAAQGGNHRVYLAGESQGAWVIGEAMTDPRLSRVVERAVLMGHPSIARTHYEDGHDPRVVELNNAGDNVTLPVRGDLTVALDAMQAIQTFNVAKLGTVLAAAQMNPRQLTNLVMGVVRWALPDGLMKDPHDYTQTMPDVVEYLQSGRRIEFLDRAA